MLWAKLAVPVVMLVGGAGALVVANDDASTVTTGAAQVWIDAPTGEAPFGPGDVTVAAHATATSDIASLDLFVDGDKVASDASLVRNERLAFAEFSWDAPVGTHELVVKQPGGSVKSDVLVVQVVEGAPKAPKPSPTTTTTTKPGDTTTSTEATTTSTTEPGETTTTAAATTTVPPGGTDTVPPTAPPTTRPPATTTTTTRPRPPAPVIDAANFTGPATIYTLGYCTYTVTVQARIRNATSAELSVPTASIFLEMFQSGSTWTATIPSGAPASAVGAKTVYVKATGPGGEVQRTVGTLTIKSGCPKD